MEWRARDGCHWPAGASRWRYGRRSRPSCCCQDLGESRFLILVKPLDWMPENPHSGLPTFPNPDGGWKPTVGLLAGYPVQVRRNILNVGVPFGTLPTHIQNLWVA